MNIKLNLKVKLGIFAVAFVLVSLLLFNVNAVNVHAEQLPNAVGTTISDAMKDTPDDFVKLDEMLYYQISQERFIRFIDTFKNSYCTSTVPPNFITDQLVSFTITQPYQLFFNDVEQTDMDISALNKQGSYVIKCETNEDRFFEYAFSIVGNTVSKKELTLPTGIYFSSLSIDEVPQALPEKCSTVSLEKDGSYSISYMLPQNNEKYLNVKSDHTKPKLALSEVVDGYAQSAVSIADFDYEDYIKIILDGKPISMPSTKALTQPGDYFIELTDLAGNVATYTFTIEMYFTVSSFMVCFCLLAVVVVIILYAIHVRRNMRIR